MINAQSSFIPLFFDEADTDLWLALQQIEPEERSSFIKEILRQVLLKNNSTEEILMKENRNPENSVLEDAEYSGLNGEEFQLDFTENELESTESFSLEALFEVNVTDQDAKHVVEFDLESLREDKPIRSAGFEYMMKHIIGTEEDEAVLEVFRGFSSKKSQ